jgi:hypothetical protein
VCMGICDWNHSSLMQIRTLTVTLSDPDATLPKEEEIAFLSGSTATVPCEFPIAYLILNPSTTLPDSSPIWPLSATNLEAISSRKACISVAPSPGLITRVGSKSSS